MDLPRKNKSQKKIYLYIILCILVTITPVFGEDVILNVGAEQYVKLMPTDVSNLQTLVREMAKMYNTLNDTHQKSIKSTTAQFDDINNDLATIKDKTAKTDEDLTNIANQLAVDKADMITAINKIPVAKTVGIAGGITVNPITFKTFQYNVQGIFNVANKLFVTANAGIQTSLKESTVEPIVGFTIGSWLF